MLIRNSPQIYQNLNKPGFAPPAWIFKLIWPILYLLMSIAFYRILMLGKMGEDITQEVILYIIQLALNLAWPIIFFYFQLRFLALIDLTLLLIFILLTVITFYRKDKISGLLLLPYLLWSTFALLLNCKVYKLNK